MKSGRNWTGPGSVPLTSDRWDYWASNADAGWGAWCVETGWVQGWLVTTFALRQMNTTLWDLASKRPLGVHLEKNLKQLLPEQK